jgi:hypothetical protein
LHHGPGAARRAHWTVRAGSFPPHVTNIKIEHLTLYLVWQPAAIVEDLNVILRFKEEGTTAAMSAASVTTQGSLIRTRQNGAPAWSQAFTNKSPVGEWEIELEGTAAQRVFDEGRLSDMFFVISFSGKRVAWPT